MATQTATWCCPYCNNFSTLRREDFTVAGSDYNHNNKNGRSFVNTTITVCPNPACREYTVLVELYKWIQNGPSSSLAKEPFETWMVRPQSSAKPIPGYVPAPIRNDYEEACAILTLSPKASATLLRRCLQGMIRDYWKISKNRLVDEIAAIKDDLEPQTWAAIDAVRNIGNIGAHMEKDINTIVEVDPDEAKLLVGLIENLIDDWYVRRHEREKQLAAIVATANAKKEQQHPQAAVVTSVDAVKVSNG
jgi:hypothetical protein